MLDSKAAEKLFDQYQAKKVECEDLKEEGKSDDSVCLKLAEWRKELDRSESCFKALKAQFQTQFHSLVDEPGPVLDRF